MKKFLLITASVLTLTAAADASAIDNTHFTHTPGTESVSSFKVAASYFLPNYDGQNYTFANETDVCSKIGYTATDCSDPNMYVPADKTCPSDVKYFNPADCTCKPEFNLTSCTGNKVLGDAKCGGKAKECVCPAKYQYTSCTDNKTLSGGSCDGKYEICGCDANTYHYDNAACKSAYGANAVTDGKACGGKYNKCTCSPSPAAGWSTTTPTCDNNGQGYETKDNGCKGTYYKCKPCVENSLPDGFQTSSTCTYDVEETLDNGCGGTYYKCKGCTNTCAHTVTSKPANSSYVLTDCTSCGTTSKIQTAWLCNSGYVNYAEHWCSSGLKCWFNSSEDCARLPDCTSLGYTKTAAQCAEKPFVRCPFDTAKYFCN